MSTPSPDKTERDHREERFTRYLAAGGMSESGSLFKTPAMLEWLVKNSFPAENDLATFLACPLYRMLKLLDSISTLPDPLGMKGLNYHDEHLGEDWIRYCVAANIQVIGADWGGDDVRHMLTTLQRAIKDSINVISDGKIRTDRPKEKYETFSGGFELIPTFGLFPFYLHKERLRFWHVIPFGVLTHLGLAMSDELAHDLLNILPSGLEVTIDTKIARSLIEEVSQDNDYRFLYLGGGHAAYRIILDSLDAVDYGRMRMNLHDIHTIPGDPSTAPKIESVLRGQDSGRNKYLLVSDLGDTLFDVIRRNSLNAEPSKRNGITCLRLELQREIPVGIGFSLVTMAKLINTPALIRGICQILNTDLAVGSDLALALARNGVKLTDETMKYVRLLNDTVESPVSKDTERARELEEAQVRVQICAQIYRIGRVPSHSSQFAERVTRKTTEYIRDTNSSKDLPNLKRKLNAIIRIDPDLAPMQTWQELEKIMEA